MSPGPPFQQRGRVGEYPGDPGQRLLVPFHGVQQRALGRLPPPGHGGRVLAGQQAGRLRGGAERDQFLGVGHLHRAPRQPPYGLLPGRAAGPAADQFFSTVTGQNVVLQAGRDWAIPFAFKPKRLGSAVAEVRQHSSNRLQ